jgi:endoglycosylceramidase
MRFSELSILLFTIVFTVWISPSLESVLQQSEWTENEDLPRIHLNERGQFVDGDGRVRLFRGLNSVKKGFPWYKHGILNETRLKFYRDWGFNALRLGAMWSGVYPQQGRVNVSYINVLQEIVEKSASYGIYSLLDMHQDVFSSKYAMYDGIPLWLVDLFPPVPKGLQFPWPQHNRTDWYFQGYFTYECEEAFQNIYDNVSNSWDHWATFWTTIASAFKSNPNIIGYELINEPFAGNGFRNPKRFLPGYAGRHNLLPVYDHLVKAIRSIDNDTMIFFEPVTWATLFPGSGDWGTGFDIVPGGESEVSRSVLSYHYYCWILQVQNIFDIPYDEWKRIVCDDILAKNAFQNMVQSQKQIRMGLFLTEFGSCSPDGNSTTINTIECAVLLDLTDQHFQSWMYWDAHFFKQGSGEIDWNLVRYFSRAYPIATAGEPVSLRFDPPSGTFEFSYALNTSITAPTEIFLPLSVHYGNNVTNLDIRVLPVGAMKTELLPGINRLLVYPLSDSHLRDGQVVSISVKKKTVK